MGSSFQPCAVRLCTFGDATCAICAWGLFILVGVPVVSSFWIRGGSSSLEVSDSSEICGSSSSFGCVISSFSGMILYTVLILMLCPFHPGFCGLHSPCSSMRTSSAAAWSSFRTNPRMVPVISATFSSFSYMRVARYPVSLVSCSLASIYGIMSEMFLMSSRLISNL